MLEKPAVGMKNGSAAVTEGASEQAMVAAPDAVRVAATVVAKVVVSVARATEQALVLGLFARQTEALVVLPVGNVNGGSPVKMAVVPVEWAEME